MTGIRAHPHFIKNILKLSTCSELLRFDNTTALSATTASLLRTPASPRTLLGTVDRAAAAAADDVRTLIANISDNSAASLQLRPRTSSLASPVRSASALRTKGLGLDAYSPASPLAALGLDATFSGTVSPSSPSHSWTLGATPSSALVASETELLRKKHLASFSYEELILLLEEMGFDSVDLRGFRLHRINGEAFLVMSEDTMRSAMVLPSPQIRKLRALQRATGLFDSIATLQRQGKVSETELRLYLAGQGASSAEVNKIINLCHTLVRVDKYDFISFWDFITSYDWIAKAFRIYGIPV